jgi:hypothetical protein
MVSWSTRKREMQYERPRFALIPWGDIEDASDLREAAGTIDKIRPAFGGQLLGLPVRGQYQPMLGTVAMRCQWEAGVLVPQGIALDDVSVQQAPVINRARLIGRSRV